MIIEIDQSGKVEETAKDTVVALANKKGFSRSVRISAREKRKLQKFFRSIGKPRMYIYRTFAILVFIILKPDIKRLTNIVIDKEYTGQEPLVKEYVLRHLRKIVPSFSARVISFQEIGKKSPAHDVAFSTYRRLRKVDITATAQDVIDEILSKQKPSS